MSDFIDGTKLPPSPSDPLAGPEAAFPPLPPLPVPPVAPESAPVASPSSPPPPEGPSTGLKVTTVVLGLLQFCLALVLAGRSGRDVPYQLGTLIGAMAVWPLIFIGLFSIVRSGRSPRMRLLICAVIWGLSCFSSISQLAPAAKRTASRDPAPVSRAVTSGGRTLGIAGLLEAEVAAPAAPAVPAGSAEPAPAAAFDFSAGSDERLVALMNGAQKERYHEISTAYARACTQRPGDARLALERVRFIEHFVYSEDLEIEEATPDHEAAVAYLTSRFPSAPGTVLYQLQQTDLDELEAKAEEYERQLGRWSAAEKAEFLLLRARAAEHTKQPVAYEYARESFRLNPTVGSGLLLAEKAHEKNNHAECLATLTHAVFSSAEPWAKKQKLDLLLQIRERGPAAALYAELKGGADSFVSGPDTAMALADAGLVAEAREVFAGLGDSEWNRKRSSLPRFVFELAHGTPAQAMAAYRALRARGLNADPFVRYRFELLRKDPFAGWNADDLTGLGALGLTALVFVGLPLLLLLPAHYWSLLRGRKGLGGGWPEPRWGLREAWLALGTLLGSSLLAVWLLKPEEMRSWITRAEAEPEILPRPSLMATQAVDWLLVGLLVAGLIWRGKAWRIFGPGRWSAGKSIGIGVLVAMGARMLAAIYVLVFPAAAAGEVPAALTQTNELLVDLLKNYGPAGMLAVIAVFVPLFEETIFRGILLQALGKHVPFFWANAAQALVFGLVHENYLLLPFFFVLGFVCGELTRRSGGLLAALVVHGCNNAVAGAALIFLHRLGT